MLERTKSGFCVIRASERKRRTIPGNPEASATGSQM